MSSVGGMAVRDSIHSYDSVNFSRQKSGNLQEIQNMHAFKHGNSARNVSKEQI